MQIIKVYDVHKGFIECKDTDWKARYKQTYYDYQQRESPDFCKVGGMCILRNYPRVQTHKGMEEASYNFIKWIGGATTDTPTTGTPRFETQLVNGKPARVQVGYMRAKGGRGKADHDIIYKGVNFKVDFKVGKDTQKPEQLKYQKRVEKAGGYYFLIHNMFELYAVIDWIDLHGNLQGFSLVNPRLL